MFVYFLLQMFEYLLCCTYSSFVESFYFEVTYSACIVKCKVVIFHQTLVFMLTG